VPARQGDLRERQDALVQEHELKAVNPFNLLDGKNPLNERMAEMEKVLAFHPDGNRALHALTRGLVDAKRYADANRLLMPPLMPLMAYRLVEIAKDNPRINCAIVGRRRYRYGPINLGFTVQAGRMLYLTVVRDADRLDAARFIDAMGDIQRRAMAHKLAPGEMAGATIAFTSMARWNVSRHVPILPPQTGLIVAHSAPRGAAKAVLGASYDHRLLSGFDVVQVLQALAHPTSGAKQ
jgi:pyruvate/2-oxoglutarate dehydrogenase complex dihydrolipoamide acyltransferase (E2) component